jgi:hypothetical protein
VAAKSNVHLLNIPRGMTGVIRPLDVSINKPFKEAVRKHCSETISAWPHPHQPLSAEAWRVLVVDCIDKAWNDISSDIVSRSFLVTGLSNSLDGKEDSMIDVSVDGQKLMPEPFPDHPSHLPSLFSANSSPSTSSSSSSSSSLSHSPSSASASSSSSSSASSMDFSTYYPHAPMTIPELVATAEKKRRSRKHQDFTTSVDKEVEQFKKAEKKKKGKKKRKQFDEDDEEDDDDKEEEEEEESDDDNEQKKKRRQTKKPSQTAKTIRNEASSNETEVPKHPAKRERRSASSDHTSSSWFVCPVRDCGQKFRDDNSMARHMANHPDL